MASMDGKKAREEGGKSTELPYMCTLLLCTTSSEQERKGTNDAWGN